MKYPALLLFIGLMTACSSAPVAVPGAGVKHQFETAIADRLIRETTADLAAMPAQRRAAYLQQQLSKFQRSVSLDLLPPHMSAQYELLRWLTAASRQLNGSYEDRVRALSSLDWSLAEHRQVVTSELDRLDQTIQVLATESTAADFDLQRHFEQVRVSAEYPEDSFEGRQRYLDQLSEALLAAQLRWPDVLLTYAPFELGIVGEEATSQSFYIRDGELVISLAQVTDLPDFELDSLAIFFGFPGLQALLASLPANSLQAELELPGYDLGWSAYILEQVATRDVSANLRHLYLCRLLTALALADLNYHTGTWSMDQAVDWLQRTTPYSRHRVQLMMNTVAQKPGYYLSAIAGKTVFSQIQADCISRGGDCFSRLNQQIVDTGPLPFDLLAQKLSQ